MDEKKCRRCSGVKKLSEYYKHSEMFDGHLNICKACTKKRVSAHREINIVKIRKYDRDRGKLPKRKKLALESGRRGNKKKGYMSSHNALVRAVRKGLIMKPEICSWCGHSDSLIEGHHPDYSKKLFVVWLCTPCHRMLHLGKSKKAEEMRKFIQTPESLNIED